MSQEKSNRCPECGTRGQTIDNATIKSLISVTLHRVEAVKHRFCPNSACTLVYFAEEGSATFYTHELRERVYQKEPHTPDILVCYCF